MSRPGPLSMPIWGSGITSRHLSGWSAVTRRSRELCLFSKYILTSIPCAATLVLRICSAASALTRSFIPLRSPFSLRSLFHPHLHGVLWTQCDLGLDVDALVWQQRQAPLLRDGGEDEDAFHP